jgi:hypothetical protein
LGEFDPLDELGVGDLVCAARQIELVVGLGRRKRVQSKASVAQQVGAIVRRYDE